MNREYYCKVGSNVELRDMGEDLREIGEKVDVYIPMYDVIPEDNLWCWLGYEQDHREWTLFKEEPKGILVDSEDLIDKIVSKKTHKFEKDKWYELKYTYRTKLCNTLVKSTSNSSNRIEFDGYYDLEEKEWTKAIGFSIDSDITVIYIQERSLEEIQQYLPDGHPDKIKEFVLPVKWCIRQDISVEVCNWFTKYSTTCNANINGNFTYLCFDREEQYATFRFTLKGYTEITLEQFKKYVLKEEKEVVLEKPVEEEFKIGEWIATTNKNYISYGKIVQVKNIDGDHIYISPDGWWERKDVRKATPEEISSVTKSEESYKVGDYVVITANTTCSNNRVGDIGRITEIVPPDFRVQVDGRPEHGNWTKLTDLRRALPSEIPHQDTYICGTDAVYTSDEPKSLLDREEIEVTIKKTVPKQFNIF